MSKSPAVAISVVMPCHNGATTLAAQLDALAAQVWDQPWELVVSDNGSTDGSPDLVRRYQDRIPNLRIVDSSAKRGVGHARNTGVAAAAGESVVFCDTDDEVAPGWLSAIGTALATHEFVAGTLEYDKLNTMWFRNPAKPSGLRAESKFLPWAFGAAIGVRRALHLAVGGFDEEFDGAGHGGGDDVDYCYRIQLTGPRLYLVPDAIVHYRIRERLPEIYRQARGYGFGSVRLYQKYRHLGRSRPPLGAAVRYWLLCLPALLPALRSREQRAHWVWRFGRRVGSLRGSLHYRALVL